MSRKFFNSLINAGIISLAITTILSVNSVKAAVGQVTRTSGADRYATAAQVAISNWITSDNVVLVSGEGYADAVSASTLAKKLKAPILLTKAEELDPNTSSALNSLGTKNVYVIGGNASISQNVRNKLKSKYTLTELGGKNRYETNMAVAEKLAKLGVDLSNIIMVGGEGFSDALSVAPVASAKEEIILLASNDINYMKPAIDFTKAVGSDVTVVGTTSVISDKICGAFNGKLHIDGGYDRFDTNLKVLSAFSSTLNFNKVYFANASNDGYADALVASAVAGKTGAVLILLDGETSRATENAIAYMKNNITKTSDLNVIGGMGVVTSNTVDAINAIISRISHDTTVTFKDKNLEKSIRNYINKPVGILYKSDVDKISELRTYNDRIQDISGIENLTSLQKLDLSYNELSDISPLKDLANLQELNLNSSNINDISSLKNLTRLENLDLGCNYEIKDISALNNLIYLKKLDLSYNYELSDISALKDLINLKELNLDTDKISNISVLGTLTNLEDLSLIDNNIKDINALKNLTYLKKLNLENSRPYDDSLGNKITDVGGLKDLTHLQFLDISSNKISNIDALEDLNKLQCLSLANNEISNIGVLKNLTNLNEISLDDTKINDISALKNLTNLQKLFLYKTKVSDADKDSLKNSLPKCHIAY